MYFFLYFYRTFHCFIKMEFPENLSHPVVLIRGSVKNYDWGKKGCSSVVAYFANDYISIEDDRPYAGKYDI